MLFIAMAGIILISGCNPEMPGGPTSTVVYGGPDVVGVVQEPGLQGPTFAREKDGRGRDTERQSCVGSEELVSPDRATTVMVMSSHIVIPEGAVTSQTVVSFNICDQNTSGSTVASRAMIFVSNPDRGLAVDANVSASLVDLGLEPGSTGNTHYEVYRYDNTTAQWALYTTPMVAADLLKFPMRDMGMYAVGMTRTVVPDTFWSVSGTVSSSGGTLNLQNSTMTFSPGALEQPTNISFSMRVETPPGLTGALPRVYEFGPEGTVFKAPVILSVSFDDAGLTVPTEAMVYFYYHDEVNNRWIRQETQMDGANRRFVVRLHHFSRYAFGR